MKLRACTVGGILCGIFFTSAVRADVTFGVIGDYGLDGPDEANVATLVKSWNPDFITTAGDNNYPVGAASTIDANIGKHYHDYIGNYTGTYGPGSATNRFWPSLGNHDWGNASNNPTGADPYKAYFTLPGNERYYDVAQGPVRLFVIDSDPNEPDSVSSHRTQGQWLKQGLATATEPFKVVIFHHASYSSSNNHGSNSFMQWPFKQWGATSVITGHDHTYERLLVDDLPYFVNGVGGAALYGFNAPVAGSQYRYSASHGAMKVSASNSQMSFDFYTVDGVLRDSYTQAVPAAPSPGTATRSFQQGALLSDGVTTYDSSHDTYVDAANPNTSFGTNPKVTVDGSPVNQGLIRFDNIIGYEPGRIPKEATILHANLRIVTGMDANDQSGNPINIYRMSRGWSETSTYNTLGSGIVIGDDCLSTAESIMDPELLGVAMNFNVTQTLQAWVDSAQSGIDSNFGWAVINSLTDGWRFSSSEAPILLDRPVLEVTYTPEPSSAAVVCGALSLLIQRRRRA